MGSRSPQATRVGSETSRLAFAAVVFAIITGLAVLDMATDLNEGTTLQHVLLEGALLAGALAGLGVLAARFVAIRRSERDARQAAAELTRGLAASREEAARWRAEAQDLLAGLGALIDRQLERWGLTPAEREVALLLLKGLSHKEVAALRHVSEATARQQAASVYRKAGLAGRHDLAAFFLEDLLAPRPHEPTGDERHAEDKAVG